MSGQVSAGVMLYRRVDAGIEVLIAHPGGPYWANKDEGAWSIPKGLVDAGEDPADAAIRELEEETGCTIGPGDVWPLGEVRLRSGKLVLGFAAESDCDPDAQRSNHFTIEWPRGSGRDQSFPEIDRIEWVSPEIAVTKLNPAQIPLVERLVNAVSSA